MATLANFPHKDQRTERSTDGRPLENGNYDCVATSIAAGVEYYVREYVNGDALKDAVYGEGWANKGTAASKYAGYVKSTYGVDLVPINGSPSELVAAIHRELAAGHPVLVTMPSQWGTVYSEAARANPSFSTHVGIAFSDDGGVITVMNPWGGFDHRGNDAYWRDRLCFRQVWALTYSGQGVQAVIDLNNAVIKGFFVDDGGRWKCKANGKRIQGGILAYYRGVSKEGLNGFTLYGLPLTDEIKLDEVGPSVWMQLFERGAIVCDPQHKYDTVPGAGDTYSAHIDSGKAYELLTGNLRAEVEQAKRDAEAARKNAQDAQAAQAEAERKLSDAERALESAKLSLDEARAQAGHEAEARQAAEANLEAAQARIAELEAEAGKLTPAQAKRLAALEAFYAAFDGLMAARGDDTSHAA